MTVFWLGMYVTCNKPSAEWEKQAELVTSQEPVEEYPIMGDHSKSEEEEKQH